MASPPFNINQSLPGDSDIVSQHPANARTMRDVVESWLLINHNNLGQHIKVELPWGTSPGTPGASLAVVYADANGVLHVVDAVKDLEVGVPIASVIFTASTVLEPGYLLADGSAVSRSTFAGLFAKISTTYGAGNGTTTFNLPDLRGRVPAGEDSASVNLTSAGLGTTAVQAAVGGASTRTLTKVNMPNYQLGQASSSVFVVSRLSVGNFSPNSVPNTPYLDNMQGTAGGGTSSFNYTVSNGAVTLDGSSTPVSIVQPTIVLKAQIKY